jgi:hypothetical protein
MVDPKEINPDGVYSFSEAVGLIPSCQAGKKLHVATLYRWHKQGKIKAHKSPGRGWFINGAELLRLLAADQVPEFHGRTPAQRNRDHERAMANLKRRGV